MTLASIQRLHSVQAHPNSEVTKLEIGKVLEWPVVIPKGQYQEGQLVVFICIDSIVPFTNPYFSFMEKQKYRIWNARFKGAPSSGLVCPLIILEDEWLKERGIKLPPLQIGDDVTELLGITKFEKGLDASIAGDAKGGFPLHLVSITDEDNLLNYPDALNELHGLECYITVKADGSSMTTIYERPEVRVCSRRLEQKEGTGFWKIADKYDLPNKLKTLDKNIVLQGEACGGKIQGNPMGLTEQAMFIFNAKEHDTGKWYGYYEIKELCELLKVPMVQLVQEPFIWDGTWNIERLRDLANNVTYIGADGKVRKGEGIVLRTTTPKYSPLIGKSFSVKIINQDYKQ